jgi:hypothetical protein
VDRTANWCIGDYRFTLAPGSWVLNFEKKSQLELKLETSQQPEPKLGTGIQLETDPEPELTPKRIEYNFWFFTFSN